MATNTLPMHRSDSSFASVYNAGNRECQSGVGVGLREVVHKVEVSKLRYSQQMAFIKALEARVASHEDASPLAHHILNENNIKNEQIFTNFLHLHRVISVGESSAPRLEIVRITGGAPSIKEFEEVYAIGLTAIYAGSTPNESFYIIGVLPPAMVDEALAEVV